MGWAKIIFPIFNNFSSINNEDSGSMIISKNNWELAHNQEDYNKVIKAIDDNRNNNDVKDASTLIIIN